MSGLRCSFSIDRGGTFTDIYCEVYKGAVLHDTIVSKLLSEDPSNYKDAPTEGIRRILERVTCVSHPRTDKVSTANIDHIRMGTTVATNALLERKGERCALITTKGFKDLQVIGNQSRPKIFDLEIRRPDLLYEYVGEVDERVVLLKESELEYNEAFLTQVDRVVVRATSSCTWSAPSTRRRCGLSCYAFAPWASTASQFAWPTATHLAHTNWL